MTYLTPSANREFPELAFHIRARRVVALVVAEGIVLVVNHLAVDVVITRDSQLAKMLIIHLQGGEKDFGVFNYVI